MADTKLYDPFAFVFELCHISSSQEELLRRTAFVGETLPSPDKNVSPSSGGILVSSVGIFMVSPPETQEGGKESTAPQDVFYTSTEEPPLPTSHYQPRPMTLNRCTVNYQEIHADYNTLGFVDLCGYSEETGIVDLGIDSELGFSEIEFTQGIRREFVAVCSRGSEGYNVCEISKRQLEEFGGLEKELSVKDGIGELPLKKLKLSKENLDFDSSSACFGIESKKIEEGLGNCEGKVVSEVESRCNLGAALQLHNTVESENIGSDENFSFCTVENLPSTVDVNKSSDKVKRLKGSKGVINNQGCVYCYPQWVGVWRMKQRN